MAISFTSDKEAVDALAQRYQQSLKEVQQVIIGQDEIVKAVLIGVFSNGTVYWWACRAWLKLCLCKPWAACSI